MRQNITADPAGSNCRWPEAYKYSQKKYESPFPATHGLLGRTSMKNLDFEVFLFGFSLFLFFFVMLYLTFVCVSQIDFWQHHNKGCPSAQGILRLMLRLSVIFDWPDIKAHAAYAQFGSKTSLSAGNWIGIAENSNPLASKYLVGIWQ